MGEFLAVAAIVILIGGGALVSCRVSLRRRLDRASRDGHNPELRRAAADVQRDIDRGKSAHGGFF